VPEATIGNFVKARPITEAIVGSSTTVAVMGGFGPSMAAAVGSSEAAIAATVGSSEAAIVHLPFPMVVAIVVLVEEETCLHSWPRVQP